MRKVRIKSIGEAFVFSQHADFLENRICFTEDEWHHTLRLGNNLQDMEAKREFWKVLLEKKRENYRYLLMDDFPLEEKPVSEQSRIAQYYCKQILEMIRGRRSEEGKPCSDNNKRLLRELGDSEW